MADELQSLLEKINAEGVRKAEAERDRIISAARAEAESIVVAAKVEAERLTDAAKAESEALKTRAESAMRQAARDTVLKLKAELEARLADAVSGATAQALDAALMAKLIAELTAKFVADPDAEITVRCAIKDRDALDAALRNALADSLRRTPTVLADPALAGGLELGLDNGRLYFDFSLEALGEVVGAYAGEHVAALFKEK